MRKLMLGVILFVFRPEWPWHIAAEQTPTDATLIIKRVAITAIDKQNE